jgi:hypothetical protein
LILNKRNIKIIPLLTDFISRYGQIQGDHHKLWVIDRVSRILNDSPIIIKEASWENGEKEYRISVGKPSEKYINWVKKMKGNNEYDYKEGIAP